jgi:hypothetical protein
MVAAAECASNDGRLATIQTKNVFDQIVPSLNGTYWTGKIQLF